MSHALQSWYIEGEFLGTSGIPLEIVHANVQCPSSLAYFCPHKGDVWARRVVLLDGVVQRWRILCIPAPGQPPHLIANPFPGSVILPLEEGMLHHLPEAVLRREFLIHTKGD